MILLWEKSFIDDVIFYRKPYTLFLDVKGPRCAEVYALCRKDKMLVYETFYLTME